MSKYELVEKTDNLEKFKVTIVGDSNDADYVTTISYYNQKAFEEDVIDALIDLKANYSDRYQLEKFDNDWIDIPFNGYDGHCHTLKSLDVEYTDKNGKVWKVKF